MYAKRDSSGQTVRISHMPEGIFYRKPFITYIYKKVLRVFRALHRSGKLFLDLSAPRTVYRDLFPDFFYLDNMKHL